MRLHHYENAVWCWTRAVLNERYSDFDATASGAKRGETLDDASGDLWREARWAISRVQDLPQRNRRAYLMKVRTQQDDTVDALCWRHYGRTQGLSERVQQANPGLAEYGPNLTPRL